MRRLVIAVCLGLIGLQIAHMDESVKSAPLPVETVQDPIGSPDLGTPDFGSPSLGTPMAQSPAEQNPDQPWLKCVFRVRQRLGNGTENHGSAVSLGKGLLVTAAHVLKTNNQAEIYFDGRWHMANFRREKNQDVAYLTIADNSLPGVSTRRPKTGEPVTVYGMTTRTPFRGTITGEIANEPDSLNLHKVQILTPGSLGTESGDSGGGVFGDDGALLLCHKGHGEDATTWGTPLNPPTPASQAQLPAASPQIPAPVSHGTNMSPVCSGGLCSPRAATHPMRFFWKGKFR